MQVSEKILQEIEGESNLAHEEMRRCSAENSLQFDDAKGYARGMSTALEIIRSHMEDDTENEPVRNPDKLDGGWIPVEERLPDENEYLCFEPTTYMRRLEIAHMTDTVEYRIGYYDGHKWMDKRHDTIKNVMAWKLHEPYQPEKGGAENHSTGVF